MQFPDLSLFKNVPEAIFVFCSIGKRPLKLCANYPYELWLDDKFVGSGGNRCVPGEAYIDE